jgi:ketosteroid isomerase-like protein
MLPTKLFTKLGRPALALALSAAVALTSATAPSADTVEAGREAAGVFGTFKTSLTVANRGASAASVTITIRRQDGTDALASPLGLTIQPGASQILYLPNTSLPTGRYSAVVRSSQPVAVLTNLRTDDAFASTAYTAIAASALASKFTFPLAYFGQSSNSSVIAVQNPNSQAASVTVAYNNAAFGATMKSISQLVPPNGAALIDANQVRHDLPWAAPHTAVLTSDRPVAAVALVSAPSRFQGAGGTVFGLGAYPGLRGTSNEVYVPSIYNAYFGYRTILYAGNAGTSAVPGFFAQYYDAAGRGAGSEMPANLSPGGALSYFNYVSPFVPFVSAPVVPESFAGTATLRAPQGATVVGVADISDSAGLHYELSPGIAAAETSNATTCASVLKNYFGYNSSVTLRNVGTAATDATLVYVDPGGATIATQRLNGLAAGASYLTYTPNLTELADGFSGSVTATSSGQKLVAEVHILGPGGGDQLISYSCEGATPAASGPYLSYVPTVVQNATVAPIQPPPATDPLAVAQSYFTIKRAGDLESVMALFDENVQASLGPFPGGARTTFPNRAALRNQIASDIPAATVDTPTNFQVNGERVTFANRFQNAQLQSVGIDFGESTDVMIIRNGKIVQWDETFTDETVAKLARAFTPPPAVSLGRFTPPR